MYLVYKTVNNLNGRFYIGVHNCYCSPCRYLGSGKVFKTALRKYGRKNFSREILGTFNTSDAAYAYESFIVNPDDPRSYNLSLGGLGGNRRGVPVVWEGVTYPSMASASRALNVPVRTFADWVKRGYSCKTVIQIGNSYYRSFKQACHQLGVHPHTVRRWVADPRRKDCIIIC